MNCLTLPECIALAENFATTIFSVKLMHDCNLKLPNPMDALSHPHQWVNRTNWFTTGTRHKGPKCVVFAFFILPTLLVSSKQGPLADMDLSLHDFSFCGWPQVVWELSVATIMNLAWIQRYQMKDMDILFPLVPYNPILSKWLGHSDLAKLGVFWCFSWFPHALEICIQILIFKFTPFKDGAT